MDDTSVSDSSLSDFDAQETASNNDLPTEGGGGGEEETSTPTTKKKKGIRFGEVRVREHERILNRRVSAEYAELDMGWAHRTSYRLGVDDFEQLKIQEEDDKDGSPKGHSPSVHSKRLANHERRQVLAKYGYKPKEVFDLEQKKKEIKENQDKGIPQPEEVPEVKPKPRKGLFSAFKKKK